MYKTALINLKARMLKDLQTHKGEIHTVHITHRGKTSSYVVCIPTKYLRNFDGIVCNETVLGQLWGFNPDLVVEIIDSILFSGVVLPKPLKLIETVHPGDVMRYKYLNPEGITQATAAKAMGYCDAEMNGLVTGKIRVTVKAAMRLAKYFNTTPHYWLGLQAAYDLSQEESNVN